MRLWEWWKRVCAERLAILYLHHKAPEIEAEVYDRLFGDWEPAEVLGWPAGYDETL